MVSSIIITASGPRGSGKSRFLTALQNFCLGSGITASFGADIDKHELTIMLTEEKLDGFEKDAEIWLDTLKSGE